MGLPPLLHPKSRCRPRRMRRPQQPAPRWSARAPRPQPPRPRHPPPKRLPHAMRPCPRRTSIPTRQQASPLPLSVGISSRRGPRITRFYFCTAWMPARSPPLSRSTSRPARSTRPIRRVDMPTLSLDRTGTFCSASRRARCPTSLSKVWLSWRRRTHRRTP